ncbi:MAG: NAD-dependent deacetylase [Myxococcota bacterium]|jgi:NAD-dependent deacetylase
MGGLSDQTPAQTAAAWIAASHHHVVFTGAGISTRSGLPDFRGPDGVWTRRDAGLPPPRAATRFEDARPNVGHMALVDLLRLGRLAHVISQNVDGLHLMSGIPSDRLSELHGNSRLLKCLACDLRYAHDAVGWDRRRMGPGYRTQKPHPEQPSCPHCGGRLISSVVNFGDPMPERETDQAWAETEACDLFVVVGSSLVVSPANAMPEAATRSGARLIILNRGETPLDGLAALRISEDIAVVLPAIVAEVRRLIGR